MVPLELAREAKGNNGGSSPRQDRKPLYLVGRSGGGNGLRVREEVSWGRECSSMSERFVPY